MFLIIAQTKIMSEQSENCSGHMVSCQANTDIRTYGVTSQHRLADILTPTNVEGIETQ